MSKRKLIEKHIIREEEGFLNVEILYDTYVLGLSCSCGYNGNYWQIKYYYNNKSPHFREEELFFKNINNLKKWIEEAFK